ncbi:hypothetical protein SNUCP5_14840 [Clostridium perfringens A]|uniref:DEAD/DEAH box helicase n=1 Tax=Clostridium perfringens TaxID=1502 RepID=UPI00399C975A
MENLKNCVLYRWLRIEYYAIANKAKFIDEKLYVDDNLILKTVRCLDYLSIIEKEKSKEYIITIIALMWEYTNKNKYNLKSFIIKILSRIGYPTSAIIIDNDFDKNEGKFLKPTSMVDMVSIALEQSYNEVVIKDKKFLLTEFQKKIWDSMESEKSIGISAPTSAGKSFVILIKTIYIMAKHNWNIVYIVPTLSLLNQVTEDYNKMLKALGIKNYKITNNFEQNMSNDINTIYVLTQEKALTAFSHEKKVFTKGIILIVDEIQNIERINDDKDLRAKILYDTLIEFRRRKNVKKIIIAGPRIKEIDELGKNIFGKNTLSINTSISPVLNLTYSIKKINNNYYFRQYCALNNYIYQRRIENDIIIEGYGQKKYQDKYMKYLKKFVKNIGENDQNIIFVPTTNTASKVASYFASDNNKISEELESLVLYYRNTVNKNYTMCKTLKSGVAYHHGKLPMHVRRTLEKAISDKKITNIICTTTLMQGVNMPAQNIIIRNPHLYINKNKNLSVELSSYEMANLRGRSGRLLKDFIGRTYVMDESEFEDIEGYNQIELFEDVKTELPSGYKDKFEEYRESIIEVIETEKTIDKEMNKYGYLVSYIRQTVLRYGEKSKDKLGEVGIDLSKKQIKVIIGNLENLEIPKDICYKNRYWDPFILNEIYLKASDKINNMPDMPNKKGAKNRLKNLLNFLRENNTTKMMYEKYIPEKYQKGSERSSLCKLCIEWACEEQLSKILSGEKYQGEKGSENIDSTIEILERIVSFNIPLLLKPIFDILSPNSIFLTCLQTGAYKKTTRKMIEIGVPRETAIYIDEKLFNEININNYEDSSIENKIRTTIQNRFDELPYWIQVQLEFMI